ncbi:hypothetical protein Tco_0973050 [Tanacetum coccineum]
MMANLSEDIQCAGSDTRPPMLFRTDFESWQQHIRLYCLGKDNGVNILNSIDEGPFKMGKFRETLAEGLPKDIYTFINHYTDAKDIWDNVKMLLEGSELTKDEHESQLYDEFEHFCQNKGETIQEYYGRQNRGQGNYARGVVATRNEGVHNRVGNANPEYFKDKMLMMEAQENRAVLDEEHLLFIAGGQTNMFDDDVDEAPVQDLALNADNVFHADHCYAFDSDVDEVPTTQTMFMANLSSADPIYDEAGPSYDSDILSEVEDHDNYVDSIGEYHEIHEMQNDVQLNYVVDSYAEYTSNSNIILYEQYAKDNAVPVVQSNVCSILNDALMMIINDMHKQTAQCVSVNEQSKVVNASLNVELARYKEQVELYERRARFELNERKQKIDEQLRIIITDLNIKEESLKKELHSIKMQLNSTIGHNKSMREEVATLKKDFK